MDKIMIYKMVNGEWEYVTWTRFYDIARIICEDLNEKGYNAKITDSKGTTIKDYILK